MLLTACILTLDEVLSNKAGEVEQTFGFAQISLTKIKQFNV